MHSEPEEDRVVRDLQSLIDHVSRIMESAVDEAINYYKQRGRRVNIQTLPDLVRDEAKHLLEKYPLAEQPYELEDLARNGLSVICRGRYYPVYHIKILKSEDGNLPVTGISGRRGTFYCQLPLLFGRFDAFQCQGESTIRPFPLEFPTPKTFLHLAFIWDVDLKTGMLCLSLVCPKHLDTNRAVVYWQRRVEHAALRIAKEQSQLVYTEDPDYGISLPTLGELGNGQEDD